MWNTQDVVVDKSIDDNIFLEQGGGLEMREPVASKFKIIPVLS